MDTDNEKISPRPSLPKRGNSRSESSRRVASTSLYKGRLGAIFRIDAVFIMRLLISDMAPDSFRDLRIEILLLLGDPMMGGA